MAGDNTYMLSSDGAGTWTAAYVPYEAMVMLGASGTTITLVRAEDGTYWLGDALVETGSMATAANGDAYMLSMVDGVWMASFINIEQTVTLGSSGSMVTLVQIEDKTWWDGDTEIVEGSVVMAENDNDYTLSMVDGEWMATFTPTMMDIAGDGGLTAVQREDGDGYDIAGNEMVMPDAKGADIMTDDGMFRITTVMEEDEDGNEVTTFKSTQFDSKAESTVLDRAANVFKGIRADDGTDANDDDTVFNEAGIEVLVDNRKHKVGVLHTSGISEHQSGKIVAAALKEINSRLSAIQGLVSVNEAQEAANDPVTDFNASYAAYWTAIEAQLDNVFGAGDHLDAEPPGGASRR